jgi:hypothetical protein
MWLMTGSEVTSSNSSKWDSIKTDLKKNTFSWYELDLSHSKKVKVKLSLYLIKHHAMKAY